MVDRETVQLFVSHHSSKADLASQVEALLAERGIKCWIAPRDVPVGTPFDLAVGKAIRESAATLLLFCSGSEKSRHVKRELILADSARRPIIPLRLEPIDPGQLEYHLADSQWIDWIDRREAVMDSVADQARNFAFGESARSPTDSHPDTAKKQNQRLLGFRNGTTVLAAIVLAIVLAATATALLLHEHGSFDQEAESDATQVALANESGGEPSVSQPVAGERDDDPDSIPDSPEESDHGQSVRQPLAEPATRRVEAQLPQPEPQVRQSEPQMVRAEPIRQVPPSLVCSFTSGPLRGRTVDFTGFPGARPGSPGTFCSDGSGSTGTIVSVGTAAEHHSRIVQPAAELSAICEFHSGPRRGTREDYSSIGQPVPIGTPCQDGQGSFGSVVPR